MRSHTKDKLAGYHDADANTHLLMVIEINNNKAIIESTYIRYTISKTVY